MFGQRREKIESLQRLVNALNAEINVLKLKEYLDNEHIARLERLLMQQEHKKEYYNQRTL